MSIISVTPSKGEKFDVEFKDIKGHVGTAGDYNRYRLKSGATILIEESLDQIRELNKSGPQAPEAVEENHDEE